MGLIIWGGVVPACLLAAWFILRRPVRHLAEDLRLDGARSQFRRQREWLEVRFLNGLSRLDPVERTRWEDAHWQNEVVWARDRQTRTLLALVSVLFPEPGFDEFGEPRPRHATALFEFKKGRWIAEGRRLDQVHPRRGHAPKPALRTRRSRPRSGRLKPRKPDAGQARPIETDDRPLSSIAIGSARILGRQRVKIPRLHSAQEGWVALVACPPVR
ncbi:MAG: hypothetical protein U0794_11420 [Isosphaeraceae bacterium]